jgi:hypothetical protein
MNTWRRDKMQPKFAERLVVKMHPTCLFLLRHRRLHHQGDVVEIEIVDMMIAMTVIDVGHTMDVKTGVLAEGIIHLRMVSVEAEVKKGTVVISEMIGDLISVVTNVNNNGVYMMTVAESLSVNLNVRVSFVLVVILAMSHVI